MMGSDGEMFACISFLIGNRETCQAVREEVEDWMFLVETHLPQARSCCPAARQPPVLGSHTFTRKP